MFRAILGLLVGFAVLGAGVGPDAYYEVPISSLTITEGTLPVEPSNWRIRAAAVEPYAFLTGDGAAYLRFAGSGAWQPWREPRFFDNASLAIRAPAGTDVTGFLCVQRADGKGMAKVAFSVPASASSPDARGKFYAAKEQHYESLRQREIAGAAWFRHQARVAGEQRLEDGAAAPPQGPAAGQSGADELEGTYAVFTGGRAVSENLQLDRLLTAADAGEATVDVASLPDINVQEIDWDPLIRGLTPEKDPLAALIPADQHGVLFPDFNAFVAVLDEAKAYGTPVLRLIEPRSENARTHERNERQLCLSANALSRILGPRVIRSVALTGSDAYLRTGSDIALLFEAPDPTVLTGLVSARVAEGARAVSAAEPVKGPVSGVPYAGFRSPDRAVCSYVAAVGSTIVVTNSLHQLGCIVDVSQGKTPSLGALPEYTFMRSRYPRGDGEETAFLILPDAAIRRWCGARWRIAASRRTRAAAVMAEVQAQHLDALVGQTVDPGPVEQTLPLPDSGELSLTADGVRSTVYGDLEFMTPIAELPLTTVTEAEANAYKAWNRRYQGRWRRYFDPIAVRFTVAPDRIAADVTVMPLIEGTEYRDLMQFAGAASIQPKAGDQHPGALVHYAMAIDSESEPLREVGTFAVGMVPGVEARPLGWLGQSIAFYADESPFWDRLKESTEDPERFIEDHYASLPVALHVEVRDGLGLVSFLTALRAFVETSAPGMTVWETLSHQGQPYVRISPSEAAKGEQGAPDDFAVYYAAGAGALVVTLDEDVLKHSLERRAARKKEPAQAGGAAAPAARPWLGSSMCLQVDGKLLDKLGGLAGSQYTSAIQRRCWGNIPVLNEWKRLYPGRDPVQVHQQVWKTRLVCPGGGVYVWNDEWHTMASTLCGHPGEPSAGATWPQAVQGVVHGNFGLTFEEEGLRARAKIERTATVSAGD